MSPILDPMIQSLNVNMYSNFIILASIILEKSVRYSLIKMLRLMGCLIWVYRPFETVFQSISRRIPVRGRKKTETLAKEKIDKQPYSSVTI